MAIAIRGKTAFANASASSVSTGAWSTAPQSGDIVIIFVYTAGTQPAAVPTSTGFTAAASSGSLGSGHQILAALTKTAGASEPASYSVACGNGTTFIAVQAICVSGASAVDVADVLQGSTASSTTEIIAMPSLTTTTANDEYIGWAFYNQNVSSITNPTGLTVYDPSDITTGWGQIIGHTTEATAGTYGGTTSYQTTFNGLTSGVGWGGSVAVALKPTTGTAFSQTLATTQSQTASLTKIANKKQAVTTTQSQTASLTKRKSQNLTATQTQTATVSKSKSQSLSATQTQTATLTVQLAHAVTLATATQPQTATLTKSKTQNLSTTQSQTARLTKSKTQALTTTQPQTAKLNKVMPKALAATQSQTATLVVTKNKLVALTATQPQTAKITKGKTQLLTTTQTQTARVTKSKPVGLSTTQPQTARITKQKPQSLAATAPTIATLYVDNPQRGYALGSGTTSGSVTSITAPANVGPLTFAPPHRRVDILTVDQYGTPKAEIADASINNLEWVLNDKSAGQITIPTLSQGAVQMALCADEVQVWVDDQLMWWGVPTNLRGNSQTLQIDLMDIIGYMEYRFITNTSLQYTSMEQMDIAAAVVAAMQSGTYQSFNIQAGAYTPSGKVRSRNYAREQHQMALDILKEFPTLNDGFDWSVEINNTGQRMFTPWYPRKGSFKPNLALEWGQNILSFDFAEDGSKLATMVYCTGGTANQIKMENHYEDTNSSSYYRQWQAIISDASELDVDWLLAMATQAVMNRNHPVITPVLTAVEVPTELLGQLVTGDSIPIFIDCGRVQVPGDTYRVTKVEWSPGGTVKYTVAQPPALFVYPPPL